MDSQSPNSSQINPASPSSRPQNPDEMQIENLPSTLDTKETLTNQATTATPLRISTSSSGDNGTVQEPIVIESLETTPQQNNLISNKKISKVFIIEDTPEQPQDSTIQIENPKTSPPKDVPVRSAIFPDQPKTSSVAADHDSSSSDEDQSAKSSEKRSVNKLSFLNKYLSSTSKSPSPVITEEKPTAQTELNNDAAADSNLKVISELAPIEESAAKETSQRMEIIEDAAPIATENIVIEQKEEAIQEAQSHVQKDLPAQEEEEVPTISQAITKEDEYQESGMESYNIMDRPPQHDDPYLADSNMLFGFRPQTSPCDPTTSPTKLARYNSLMSQGSDMGKLSAGYKFGHGEDSRGIDVRGDLMAMMNAENSMPIDAGVVREEYEEHETEETEGKTSQKKEVKMTKVERVQTIINGSIVKESPKHSEPDLNNNKEIEAIVESIVSPKQETTQEAQENDHSMAIENEAKYQPSLGEVVEFDSQTVVPENAADPAVQSPVGEQTSSPREGRSSIKKLKEVREEEVDEKIAQEEEVNKFEETAGATGEMSLETMMDEERRKSEAEPVPMRHAKTPNYLERKLQKIQEDNLKSMGDFEFKKKQSKLEKEKMEAKQNEAYKPKVQLQKVQETSGPTFMSDTKQHFSKLQLEKMASKAKEGTQSAMQKTQPRNTSKSPVPPQRKVVTPSAIPSRTNINKPNANAVSPLNRSTASHLKRKFDALKPQNGQNVPQQTAGHDMKKVKLTEDLNISAFSLAESVMVTKENMPGNINMQSMSIQKSGILTKREPSTARVSGSGNGMPKTSKSCVFCGDAFTNKNDTKMMSCLHKAHTNCYVQMERRKKASCPLCNSNTSPISGMYAMPKPAAYKF